MRVSLEWLNEYIETEGLDLPVILEECGFPVEEIIKVGDDNVYDIEVTANRPDMLSMIGVAREIRAKTGRQLRLPETYEFKDENRWKDFSVKVENFDDTPRYIACKLEHVPVKESPDWLKRRIKSYGLNPKNVLVDLTNYIAVELGQPLHAFSESLVEGKTINVRRAVRGEEIVTLLGEKKVLDNSILVIADAEKPIALAGIIGGEESGVKRNSESFIIESAYFNPILVRKGSKKLNIKTDASYRFERGGYFTSPDFALKRFLYLLKEIVPEVEIYLPIDVYDKIPEPVKIELDRGFIRERLGYNISDEEIDTILKRFDFEVKKDSVVIPDYRRDLSAPIDLVEEVGRIFGYSNIPDRVRIPEGVYARNNKLFNMVRTIRDALVGLGYYENVTLGLVSKRELGKIYGNVDNFVRIANPINVNIEYMTPTPSINLLKVVKNNILKSIRNIKIFEFGRGFAKGKNAFIEKNILSVMLFGMPDEKEWYNSPKGFDLFDIKGVAEYIFDLMHVAEVKTDRGEYPLYMKDESVSYKIGDMEIARCGRIRKDIENFYEIENGIYSLDIDLDKLLDYTKERSYERPSAYPSVYRDLALVMDKSVLFGDLLNVIYSVNSLPSLKVKLFDIYIGKQIPEGKKSMAVNLEFNGLTRTLKDDEVEVVVGKIVESLKEKFGAYLREK
ncbi:phenylalanine--tRNA ligase subunit beta [candidate division WOR-3 bacterium]|nr:phenylalanine--tRNA ligase subunit beta [candidate division WOR-3 bacterium]